MTAMPDPQTVREIAAEVIRAAIEDRTSDALNCLLEERGLIESAWTAGYTPWHGAVATVISEMTKSWPPAPPTAEQESLLPLLSMDDDVRAVAQVLAAFDVMTPQPTHAGLVRRLERLRARFADRIAAHDARTADGSAGCPCGCQKCTDGCAECEARTS